MTTTTMILVVVIILALVAVWLYMTRRRAQLKARFGPEYEHAVRDAGSPLKAEAALDARAKRVSKYTIRPLTADESDHFRDAWHQVQGNFVDDPAAAVAEADVLVTDLMNTRGYPTSDFERRVEDVSVDHPSVVSHYRDAHAIAVRHARNGVSTEDLRKAIVHYRALFDDLLDLREPVRKPA
jgi:hypothetical protein